MDIKAVYEHRVCLCEQDVRFQDWCPLGLFEVALVLVRFDHVASVIVNTNDGGVRADEILTAFVELEMAIRSRWRLPR